MEHVAWGFGPRNTELVHVVILGVSPISKCLVSLLSRVGADVAIALGILYSLGQRDNCHVHLRVDPFVKGGYTN